MDFGALRRTPQAAIGMYLERLPRRQAELKFLIFEAVGAALADKGTRERMLGRWRREMEAQRPTRKVTREALQSLGIGVGRRDE